VLTQEFRQNRRRFPPEELARHRGQWVAFSLDGVRIVASAATLAALEERLKALGEDAQRLAFEHVPAPEDDPSLGAEDLA
jgi:hypothetical protein